MTNSGSTITLKVAGLDHNEILKVKSEISIDELKAEIETRTRVPAAYQRLICHGKNLDTTTQPEELLQDRTKILLLHNESYAADKEACEKIQSLRDELDKIASETEDPVVRHDLVTQVCCKLDAVDVHGSDTLRALRKDALRVAEEMEQNKESDDD